MTVQLQDNMKCWVFFLILTSIFAIDPTTATTEALTNSATELVQTTAPTETPNETDPTTATTEALTNSATELVQTTAPTETPNETDLDSEWFLLKEGACFEGKNDQPAVVPINQKGTIVKVKLVHKVGFVKCQVDILGSNFGCYSDETLFSVFICDKYKHLLFPSLYELNLYGNEYFGYIYPSHLPTEKEVIYTEYINLWYFNNGDNIYIWNNEDLLNLNEDDNVGQSCVDVYVTFASRDPCNYKDCLNSSYCNVVYGFAVCSCPTGYILHTDAKSCLQDPCYYKNCSFYCNVESGNCLCPTGYTLDTDETTCLATFVNNCLVGWLSYEKACYLFVVEKKNWTDSELSCKNYGANLLSVRDQAEQQFIVSKIYRNLGYNIGLNAINNNRTFVWSDKTDVTFQNWETDEPNNYNDKNEECVQTSTDGWNDIPCDLTGGYICKVKECNGECTGQFSICVNNKCQCQDKYPLINGNCTDVYNCGRNYTFNGLSGEIKFPNIGSQYSNNVECRWLINVGPNILYVDINNIDMQCGFDYVAFYDDPTYLNQISFCSKNNVTMVRDSGVLYIKVVTDGGVVKPGFKLTWNSVAKDCNGGCTGQFSICINYKCQCQDKYSLINGNCTGNWGDWVNEVCSQSCGNGILTRKRTCSNGLQCITEESYNYVQIQGNISCNLKTCGNFVSDKASVIIPAITVPGLVVLIVFAVIVVVIRRKKMKDINHNQNTFPMVSVVTSDTVSLDKWEIFPDYIVLDRNIGEGAFGTVFVSKISTKVLANTAYASLPSRTASLKTKEDSVYVAAKLLKDGASHSEIKDFVEEINLMKNIGYHKNIVNMIGCSTINKQLCLVVEYMENGDLLQYLRNLRNKLCLSKADKSSSENNMCIQNYQALWSSPEQSSYQSLETQKNSTYEIPIENMEVLNPEDLLNFAWQVASGMEYLSCIKLVHRDLAARNILVGSTKNLKISDFGLSRILNSELNYMCLTNRRLPIKWMSIEALHDQTFTIYSDVWSYGVVLFEIVTLGGTPYPAINNRQLLKLLKSGYRMDRPENCSESMYDIMLHCWAENPTERPSFTDLRQRLENLLNQSNRYLNLDINYENVYYSTASFKSLPSDSEDAMLEEELFDNI